MIRVLLSVPEGMTLDSLSKLLRTSDKDFHYFEIEEMEWVG